MADLGALLQQHVLWQSTLPLVRPFYPVKCNSSPAVIEILAALGVGFVCANKVTFYLLYGSTLIYWRDQDFFFYLIPFNVLAIFFRLKCQWYSTTTSPPRTSSCLVFANSSRTSNTLPRTESITWCAITRPSSEKSPVPTQTPSQFPQTNKHAHLGFLYLMPRSSINVSYSGQRYLSSQAAPAAMHRGSNRGGKHGVWLLAEKLQASFRRCQRAGSGCGWSSVSLLFSASITFYNNQRLT